MTNDQIEWCRKHIASFNDAYTAAENARVSTARYHQMHGDRLRQKPAGDAAEIAAAIEQLRRHKAEIAARPSGWRWKWGSP